MHQSGSIDEILRQLAEALRSTWSTNSNWLKRPSQKDLERYITHSVAILNTLRESKQWRAIPSVLYVLAHENKTLRASAAEVISDLARFIPNAALPHFEKRVRDSTLQAYSWNELTLEWVTAQEWPARVWALFTMHPSGFVREAAVRRLASNPESQVALPFLLLRINDWVNEVRAPAAEAVRQLITAQDRREWIEVMGLLDQLRRRGRTDHAWLSHDVAELFIGEDARPELMDAVQSTDRGVSRWAFGAAMRLPEVDRGEFVRIGLECNDPITRLKAASIVGSCASLPGRSEMLERMKVDRSAPVRRAALYAMLGESADARFQYLMSALLDRHASIRHAARYYLGKDAEQGGKAFDARTEYLSSLANSRGRPTVGGIAGIGECGIPSDTGVLVPFVSDGRPGVASAAVRAIAALDRDARLAWFTELLEDSRPAVAKEAARALGNCVSDETIQRIRATVRAAPHAHSRRLALRLLLGRHPYDAIADAITTTESSDAILATAASNFIESGVRGCAPCGPSATQLNNVRSAIGNLSKPLPDRLRKRVRALIGIIAS